jgi:hypothetical protein
MFLRFELMMEDDRFLKLLKNYDGNNPEIVKRKPINVKC